MKTSPVFEPNRIVIEQIAGTLIEVRDNRERSFEGQKTDTLWDDIHSRHLLLICLMESCPPESIARVKRGSSLKRRIGLLFAPPIATPISKTFIAEFASVNDAYLRRFPVWCDFRGNSSVLLSQAKALSTAANLRGDLDAEDLAQSSPETSAVASVRSRPMVGDLPVGIETKDYEDAPYWPTQICWTYKEVWTAPVGQWIWLMDDLRIPATVRGLLDPANREPIEFREEQSGQLISVLSPAGSEFSVRLRAGRYVVQHGDGHTSLTALPGTTHLLDLRANQVLDFKVSFDATEHNEIVIRTLANGAGDHTFSIRSDNLVVSGVVTQNVHPTGGTRKEIIWHARLVSPETPWVALVIPDGDLSKRTEVTVTSERRPR